MGHPCKYPWYQAFVVLKQLDIVLVIYYVLKAVICYHKRVYSNILKMVWLLMQFYKADTIILVRLELLRLLSIFPKYVL